jgi:arylsulfatase A-like enzyme
LLWLAWGPPHDPYLTAPPKYRAMYDPATLTLRGNVPAEGETAARRNIAGYYAHCSALDDAMGQLLATLEETGLAENTIFIFSSDHGDMLGSRGMWKKQKPFDESACVPFLVRWPAGLGRTAKSLNAPISSEDFLPTVLGLVGQKAPPSAEGQDFSGYLGGGAAPGDGAALLTCVTPFGEFERRNGGREYRGIRTARNTYVRSLEGPWLLFDNEADPLQLKNLVGTPENAALEAELAALLDKKLKASNDAFLPGPEYIKKWDYAVDANGTMPYAK